MRRSQHDDVRGRHQRRLAADDDDRIQVASSRLDVRADEDVREPGRAGPHADAHHHGIVQGRRRGRPGADDGVGRAGDVGLCPNHSIVGADAAGLGADKGRVGCVCRIDSRLVAYRHHASSARGIGAGRVAQKHGLCGVVGGVRGRQAHRHRFGDAGGLGGGPGSHEHIVGARGRGGADVGSDQDGIGHVSGRRPRLGTQQHIVTAVTGVPTRRIADKDGIV